MSAIGMLTELDDEFYPNKCKEWCRQGELAKTHNELLLAQQMLDSIED